MEGIAIAVVLAQDPLGLLVLALADQPTRTLRAEPDEGALEDRRESLEDRRDAPGPGAAGDAESTKGRPLNNQGGLG